MSQAPASPRGSGASQRDLWAPGAKDWAEVQESRTCDLYVAVLDRLPLPPGSKVLDVGCGSGVFLELAVERGLSVSGRDATPALLDAAKRRVPSAVLREADLESLPFGDAEFDLVTGFNALQYAAQPVQALREARRVSRPGGQIVIATWGKPERCEAAGQFRAMEALMPLPPPGTPGRFALSVDGALIALAAQAGLQAVQEVDVPVTWSYPDLTTALRGLLSAGPAIKAIRHAGEPTVRAAVTDAIAPYRNAMGGYALRSEFRYLLAQV